MLADGGAARYVRYGRGDGGDTHGCAFHTHGKRLFRMAPIHHHFQEKGWSEMQVVQRFWLISLLFAMLGVGLAAM